MLKKVLHSDIFNFRVYTINRYVGENSSLAKNFIIQLEETLLLHMEDGDGSQRTGNAGDAETC